MSLGSETVKRLGIWCRKEMIDRRHGRYKAMREGGEKNKRRKDMRKGRKSVIKHREETREEYKENMRNRRQGDEGQEMLKNGGLERYEKEKMAKVLEKI